MSQIHSLTDCMAVRAVSQGADKFNSQVNAQRRDPSRAHGAGRGGLVSGHLLSFAVTVLRL